VGLVGQERYAEAVLLLELVLGLDRIGGDSQNVRAGLLVFGPKLRESMPSRVQPGVSALG